jgi:hypothetical protein
MYVLREEMFFSPKGSRALGPHAVRDDVKKLRKLEIILPKLPFELE